MREAIIKKITGFYEKVSQNGDPPSSCICEIHIQMFYHKFCEGERVVLGHFHERVGESPRSYENFGTSGSKIARFVSEIWPFKVGIAMGPNFTM